MNTEAEQLQLECRWRLLAHMDLSSPPTNPIDLWVTGFWSGVQALRRPRPLEELQRLLRERAASMTPAEGDSHEDDRPGTDPDPTAGRESDAAAADLVAYLLEAYGAQRRGEGA